MVVVFSELQPNVQSSYPFSRKLISSIVPQYSDFKFTGPSNSIRYVLRDDQTEAEFAHNVDIPTPVQNALSRNIIVLNDDQNEAYSPHQRILSLQVKLTPVHR